MKTFFWRLTSNGQGAPAPYAMQARPPALSVWSNKAQLIHSLAGIFEASNLRGFAQKMFCFVFALRRKHSPEPLFFGITFSAKILGDSEVLQTT